MWFDWTFDDDDDDDLLGSVFLLEMVTGDSNVRAQRDNQSKSQYSYGWQVTSSVAEGKL